MQYIRVKITRDKSNTVKSIPLEEYLRGVVPSESYASWPLEALRAQAVAARTYAHHKMTANAKKDFDVDDTTSCQAYNPSKIDSRTDAVVKATAGQILTHSGRALDTCVYCAANGGYTVSALEHWPKGGGRPYLPAQKDPYDERAGYPLNGHGVGMSQRGAMQMAKEGKDYKTILAFYYPGTKIETLEEGDVSASVTESLTIAPFTGVRTFSLKRDGEKKLSANLTVKEFAADNRCTGDEIVICGELVQLLQRIRDHYDKPINISSGYRTPAGTSQHNIGRAADFRIPGVNPRDIVRWIEATLNPPGLGLYDYNPVTEKKDGFVHIDYRTGAKSRWYQTKADDSDYTPIGSRDITTVYLNKK